MKTDKVSKTPFPELMVEPELVPWYETSPEGELLNRRPLEVFLEEHGWTIEQFEIAWALAYLTYLENPTGVKHD
jgi:hypothetical protein